MISEPAVFLQVADTKKEVYLVIVFQLEKIITHSFPFFRCINHYRSAFQ